MESKEKELFLVVSREVENNQGWLIESTEKENLIQETEKENLIQETEKIVEYINDNEFENANIDLNLNNSKEKMNENGNFCNNQSSR
jgi:hypothetical protein